MKFILYELFVGDMENNVFMLFICFMVIFLFNNVLVLVVKYFFKDFVLEVEMIIGLFIFYLEVRVMINVFRKFLFCVNFFIGVVIILLVIIVVIFDFKVFIV